MLDEPREAGVGMCMRSTGTDEPSQVPPPLVVVDPTTVSEAAAVRNNNSNNGTDVSKKASSMGDVSMIG